MAPLIFIIISAVVISYPWASNLVFMLAGSRISLPAGPPGPGGMRIGPPSGPSARGALPVSGQSFKQVPLQLESLDLMLGNVQKQSGLWKTISFQLPAAANKTVAFSVDAGSGGRPQFRSTVTVDQSSGEIRKTERFKDLDPGLRARLWIRFVHLRLGR
jgi:uncharacterized iron-regulated membrane protein